jgi:hypothetical protein
MISADGLTAVFACLAFHAGPTWVSGRYVQGVSFDIRQGA